MKNLINYDQTPFDIYQAAVNSKKDNDLKNRLNSIERRIIAAYQAYNHSFTQNSLERLALSPVFTPRKEDLLSLYKFTSLTIRRLKKAIDDLQPFPLGNTCQNCTINSVNSMDHVLGQASFPEYVVHPLNLFPSCTECNGYKNASFVRNGTRRFLNLYSDRLPDQQYLFVNVFVNNHNDLDWNYEVQNRAGIDRRLFALIQNHYEELRLFTRMKERSIKAYTELRKTIASRLNDLRWEVVVRQVIQEANDNKQNLGLNHFEYVLQAEMVNNELFRRSFLQT